MTSTEKEYYSIVMPVYSEADHIGALLHDVEAAMNSVDALFEFVLVDDGSPDNTWEVLSEMISQFPMLRAFRLSRNFGKESAIRAGMEQARGNAVIVMDADGQHPPKLLPEMVGIWRKGDVDIVEGLKASRGKETLFNRVSAGLFYIIWNRLSGFELRKASDFKLLGRRAVDAYLQMRERNLFFRGMTAWVGFRRMQIPFEVADRAGGRSGWSLFRLVRLALTGITSFSAIPLQIVTLIGILFLIFAFLFGLQTLYVYLIGHAVTGFATVIFLLLIIGSLLMISIGIIGEYLARIFEEVKSRPSYLIESVLETSSERVEAVDRAKTGTAATGE